MGGTINPGEIGTKYGYTAVAHSTLVVTISIRYDTAIRFYWVPGKVNTLLYISLGGPYDQMYVDA